MTAVRGKPSGFGVHDKLTSVIMEIIDSQLPQLVDGLGGGTYTPSAPIVIAGTHGLSCTGVVAFSGSVACNANTVTFNGSTCALVGSSLTVDATSNITTAVGSLVTCNGSTTFNGTVTHNESFSLNSAKVFSCAGTLALGGSGSITGTAGSTVNLNGTAVTLQAGTTVAQGGIITNSGAGRSRLRVVTGSNSDSTYSVATADIVMVPALTASRIYKLTSTGAGEGDTIRFSGYGSTAHAASIVDDGSFALGAAVASLSAAGTISAWADFVFTSGAWKLTAMSLIP